MDLLRDSGSWLTHRRRPILLFLLTAAVLCTVAINRRVFSAASESSFAPGPAQTDAVRANSALRFGDLPLSFEPNEGQVDQEVKFLARGPGYKMFLTANQAVLTLHRPEPGDGQQAKLGLVPKSQQSSVVRVKLLSANRKAAVAGEDELPGKTNYLLGNDPQDWHLSIPTYRKVRYQQIYPGIDLIYYGNRTQLEYDFEVAPGADLKKIRFQVEGADGKSLDADGNLVLKIKESTVRLCKPFIYQLEDDGKRKELSGSYFLKGNTAGFKVGSYDRRKTLVIDPILSYSTLLGGGGNEYGYGVAVDSLGSAYITGATDVSAFPTTPGAFQTTAQGGAFVTKLNPTGTSLVYSTYLAGSSGGATGTAIAVNSAGEASVTGHTFSADFPTVSAVRGGRYNLLKTTDSGTNWLRKNIGSLNVPVLTLAVDKITPTTIYAGTAFGSSSVYKSVDSGNTWTPLNTGLTNASCPALVIDPLTPTTIYAALIPSNFTGGGVFKSTDGGNNWSSASSGLNSNLVTALAIDPQTPTILYAGSQFGLYKSINGGASWVSSSTGLNFGGFTAIVVDPLTPSTIYATAGGGGVFKSTNSAGNWGQVNNGLTTTTVATLAIDPGSPSTLYAGTLGGGVFKTTNGGANWTPINSGPLASNAPVKSSVLHPASTTTLYIGTNDGQILKTIDGGTTWTKLFDEVRSTHLNALAIDANTPATVYAGVDTALQSLNDFEAFVSKLNAAGSGLVYSTFIGGSGNDFGYGIALDSSGAAYVTGETASANFLLANPFQSALNGPKDAFVTKLNANGALSYSTYLGGSAFEIGRAVAVDQTGDAYLTGATSSSDFPLLNPIGGNSGSLYVTKLNPTGTGLVYSSVFPNGSSSAITVDNANSAYVAGTAGAGFPITSGAFQTSFLGGTFGDAFVMKLNPAGSAQAYSTYLGGSNSDFGRGVAVDGFGNAYVTGYTNSIDFPLALGSLRTKSPVFKSTDGGAHWGNDNYGIKGTGVASVVIDPKMPSTIYLGTSGGVYKSTNGGSNWSAINNGLGGININQIVIDPITPANLYASSNDNLGGNTNGIYRSMDGGNNWSRMVNGLSNTSVFSLAINPQTPTTLYAGTSGSIFKSTDGANSWAVSGNPSIGSAVSIAVDPITPTTIYAADNGGSTGVARSTDAGASWQRVGANQSGPYPSFVAVSPLSSGTVYVSTNTGLFKSVDGGDNWTLARSQSAFSKVVFDPVSASTIYVLSFFDGVLKSVDNGQTWKPINKGFQVPAAISLAINPARPNNVYAAMTSAGDNDVFVSKINPIGSALIYSTLLGGGPAPGDSSGQNDQGYGIAVDSTGNAYVTGESRAPDFPTTPDSFQSLNRGFSDAFVSKLSMSFVISGRVLDGGGAGVSEAQVILNDGSLLTAAITEGDGSYQFAHLPGGGNFTVGATKPHFSITPTTQSFSNLAGDQIVNFLATPTNAPFFKISGRIAEGTRGLEGANVTLSGSQLALTTADSNGDYSFTVPGGGNYTVTPASLGFSFAPPSRTFNALSTDQTADFPATRLSLVVSNAQDHGVGSLRQAMLDANEIVGPDTIVFNIPGSGVHTISLDQTLPVITDPVAIDGTSQPGYAGAPLIELNGNGGDANKYGLKFTANNCTVRGLAIDRFGGFGIWFFNSNNNVVQGNYIGLDPTGSIRRGNSYGIVISGNNNLIGGTTTASRNVISSSSSDGISIGGANNRVQGNFIGTDATGTIALGNSTGLSVSFNPTPPGSANNLIGGLTPGAGNVISGNQTGISMMAAGSVIQGNLIGTDITGTMKVGNGTGINSGAQNTLIGGNTPAARNIISGNTGDGVDFGGAGSRLQGNFIGTDITGTQVLGNGGSGVGAGSGALIGGTNVEERNIISGNGGSGNVSLGSNNSGPAATVQGNYIGTDVTGNVALNNPSAGVALSGSNNVIGGLAPGARNIISGNRTGVQIGGSSSSGPAGNLVQGNYIGLNADGTQQLPNLLGGVAISDSSNNTVGGNDPHARNRIAFNTGPAVSISSGTGNLIRGNSMMANTGLGIDLLFQFHTGVNNNDACDGDSGPNNLQNYPVLSSAISTSNSTTVQGTLNSTANTTFTIEFFTNTACDSLGFGEGQQSLGTATVTTDANCVAGFIVNLPFAVGGQFLTATAADPNGNTSEISNCFQATGAPGPTVQFASGTYSVNENNGAATITLARAGDTSGVVTVDYATSDDTAHQSGDYSVASGSLTFGAGETSKSFAVLISKDAYAEGNEKLNLSLGNPGGGATLGSTDTAVLTIVDDPSVPVASQPLDDAGNFVTQHYHDFLSREPDPSGFGFWVGQITQCGSDQTCLRNKRIDVSNAFFYELEYQQTGSFVYRLYRAAFGNNQPFPNPIPDPNNPGAEKKVVAYQAFVQDRARVIGGSNLAQSQLDLANAFVLRPQFVNKYPANLDGPGFVDAVLATIKDDLGADLTSQRAALITLFNSGGRGAVMYRLADDNAQTNPINNRAFIDAEYNRAFVATQYFGYLRRDPDMGGFLFWLNQVSSAPLRDVARQHAMVCSFITSAEYQLRFSSVVSHNNSECQP